MKVHLVGGFAAGYVIESNSNTITLTNMDYAGTEVYKVQKLASYSKVYFIGVHESIDDPIEELLESYAKNS